MNVLRLISCLALLLVSTLGALAQSDYRIRAGDTLNIEVLEDPALNRALIVLPDGRISFPFAGTLVASGRTIGEVEQTIRGAIASNFAAPPNVFVSVQPAERRVRSGTPAEPVTIDVYFLGEVANPGRAQLEPGTTLLQGFAISGGFSRFAAIKRVQLRRTDHHGVETVTTINYKALSDGVALNQDIELKDGDVILVPERRLFE